MNTTGLHDLFWLIMLLGSTTLISKFVVLAQLHFLLHLNKKVKIKVKIKKSCGAIKTKSVSDE